MCRIRQMKNWNFFGWYLILNIIFRCFSSSKVRCWHAEGFLRARHCRLVAFVSCLRWWSPWSKHDKTIHLKNTQWRSKKWAITSKIFLKACHCGLVSQYHKYLSWSFWSKPVKAKKFGFRRFLKMVTLKLFPTMMCVPYHEGLKKRKVLLTIAPTLLISSWPRGIHWCWCPIRDVIWYKLFVWYNQSYAWSYVGYNQSYVQSIGYSMASQSG